MTTAFDLHLTEEQRELYDRTRELAATSLAEIARAGTPGRVNRPLIEALAEHGLLPRLFEDGAISAIELCLIREALARDVHGGRDRVRGSGTRDVSDPPGRRRVGKGRVDPSGRRRQRRRRLRAHRTRRGLGRRRARVDGRTGSAAATG